MDSESIEYEAEGIVLVFRQRFSLLVGYYIAYQWLNQSKRSIDNHQLDFTNISFIACEKLTTLQKSYFNVQFRKNITYICSPGWKNQCSVKGLSKCYCSQKVLSLISKPPCLSKRDQYYLSLGSPRLNSRSESVTCCIKWSLNSGDNLIVTNPLNKSN